MARRCDRRGVRVESTAQSSKAVPLGLAGGIRTPDLRVNPMNAAPRSLKWIFRLHRAPGQRIVRATAYVNGHRVRRIEGPNLRWLVIQRLPKGRFTLRIVKLTSRGHRVISVRTY